MLEFNSQTWLLVSAGCLVVGFIVGWLWGRRGNATRPLNKIAKSLAVIAKNSGQPGEP